MVGCLSVCTKPSLTRDDAATTIQAAIRGKLARIKASTLRTNNQAEQGSKQSIRDSSTSSHIGLINDCLIVTRCGTIGQQISDELVGFVNEINKETSSSISVIYNSLTNSFELNGNDFDELKEFISQINDRDLGWYLKLDENIQESF